MMSLVFCKYLPADTQHEYDRPVFGLFRLDVDTGATESLAGSFPAFNPWGAIATAPDGYVYFPHTDDLVNAQDEIWVNDPANPPGIARLKLGQTASQIELLYAYPNPDKPNSECLPVREICVRPSSDPQGYRIYFSAQSDPDPSSTTIYYLDPQQDMRQAKVYLTLENTLGGQSPVPWGGAFTFSDKTLYLVSGRSSNGTLFRLRRAELDHVDGSPQFVASYSQGLYGIAHASTGQIYFVAHLDGQPGTVVRLDLETGTFTTVYTTTDGSRIIDLAPLLFTPTSPSPAPGHGLWSGAWKWIETIWKWVETHWADLREWVKVILERYWWPKAGARVEGGPLVGAGQARSRFGVEPGTPAAPLSSTGGQPRRGSG